MTTEGVETAYRRHFEIDYPEAPQPFVGFWRLPTARSSGLSFKHIAAQTCLKPVEIIHRKQQGEYNMIRFGRQTHGHGIGLVIEDWGINVWLIWWWLSIGRAYIAGQPRAK